jgi:C4-dicarboxylate-specific signal transduction histidine kinase
MTDYGKFSRRQLIERLERLQSGQTDGLKLEAAARLQREETAYELTSLLAHELNQPLAAISMFAEAGRQLLARQPLDRIAAEATLQQIVAQALRCGEILRRLRTFLKPAVVEPTALDLNAVVERACSLLDPVARAAGIRLELQLHATLPPVNGVDVHLEQVVLSLLRQLFEAMHGSAAAGQVITVETALEGHLARVTVRNGRHGMDAGRVERMFGSGLDCIKQGDAGVGLRISRRLVEARGGSLWVDAAPAGDGFHFTIPLAE